jgi:hypothetical protein
MVGERSVGVSEQDGGNEQKNFGRLQTGGDLGEYCLDTISLVAGGGSPDYG